MLPTKKIIALVEKQISKETNPEAIRALKDVIVRIEVLQDIEMVEMPKSMRDSYDASESFNEFKMAAEAMFSGK